MKTLLWMTVGVAELISFPTFSYGSAFRGEAVEERDFQLLQIDHVVVQDSR